MSGGFLIQTKITADTKLTIVMCKPNLQVLTDAWQFCDQNKYERLDKTEMWSLKFNSIACFGLGIRQRLLTISGSWYFLAIFFCYSNLTPNTDTI